MWQSRCIVLALLSLSLCAVVGAPLQQGRPGFIYDEDDAWCAGIVIQTAITANANHAVATGAQKWGGAKWGFEGDITETEKINQNNDKFAIDMKVLHKIAVPGHANEVANTKKLSFKISVEAGKGKITKVGANVLPPAVDSVKHNAHTDKGVLTGTVLLDTTKKQILAYILTLTTDHCESGNRTNREGLDIEACAVMGQGMLIPIDLPDDVFGSAAWKAYLSDGEFGISVSAANLSASDVLAAHIRLGSPDVPGAIVFSFDPADFEDLDGLGARYSINAAQFPLENVDDLIGGDTFLEIVTATGRLAGQLERVISNIPAASEWGLIVMTVLMLTAGTVILGRHRRAAA